MQSIVHALNLLGKDELRKWVSVMAAISLSGPRTTELIRMALTRARFCELLAEHLKLQATDFFLVGLFSLLDAILGRAMARIIELIPISTVCSDALCGVSNPLRQVLELAIACERGRWQPSCRTLRESGMQRGRGVPLPGRGTEMGSPPVAARAVSKIVIE